MNDHKDPTDVGMLMEGNGLDMNKYNDNLFSIKRPAYTQHDFDLKHNENYIKKSWKRRFLGQVRHIKKDYFHKEGVKRCIRYKFPVFPFMMKYKWKEWFLADFIAGLIVGIMHIPQSMAYSQLAGLKPMYGLYVSFFPVIVYFFFGTSRHVSIGTIAIVSLLTGKFLEKSLLDFPLPTSNQGVLSARNNYSLAYDTEKDGNILTQTTIGAVLSNKTYSSNTTEIEFNAFLKATELLKANRAAGFTFVVGIVQLMMGFFNLGFMTKYLSDPLISGFTVGSSMHVFTSQVKYCFGVNIPKQFGAFNIVKTYYYIARKLPETNLPTFGLTLVCIVMLVITKEFINPHVVRKIRVPIPMELIVVIIGTIVSNYLHLGAKYKVRCVGEISRGLPPPTLPDLNNLSNYLADIIITAIVAFSVGVSLAKIFSKKHGYEIDTNQELLAYGIMNFVSSFFLCYPAATSLSRSAVQDAIGGKSQLTSIVSSILLLFVLLFIGPVFYALPSCILAAIIIVALKGMFMQFSELKDLWGFSFWDFSTWVIAFMGTVFIDVEYGLVLGIGYSILIIMLRTQSPKFHILGQIRGTDLYKNLSVYDDCQEIEGIKIFRYEGSLYFASCDHFKNSLYLKTCLNPQMINLRILKLERKLKSISKKETKEEINPFIEIKTSLQAELEVLNHPKIHHLIIDCSTWGYIDYVGVKTLNQVIEEYKVIGVTVFLANPKTDVRATIFRNDSPSIIDNKIIYLSVHDAVVTSLNEHRSNHLNNCNSEKNPI